MTARDDLIEQMLDAFAARHRATSSGPYSADETTLKRVYRDAITFVYDTTVAPVYGELVKRVTAVPPPSSVAVGCTHAHRSAHFALDGTVLSTFCDDCGRRI